MQEKPGQALAGDVCPRAVSESEKCGDLGFSVPDQRNSPVRQDRARLATRHLAADCCLHSLVPTSGRRSTQPAHLHTPCYFRGTPVLLNCVIARE
uniref:Uncharacterized protein n=1 Tax=Otus sunia TaxID=257818 RepID=A0A8C8ABL6_9STRI